MSAVMWITQKSRLSKLVDEAGGQTVATALAAAEAETQGLKDEALERIEAAIAELEAAVRTAPTPEEAPAWIEKVYALSSGLLDVAGPFGLEDMCAAAYSLCALADRMKGGFERHLEAVRLHVGSIRLLTSKDHDAETRAAVLAGLIKISERSAKSAG